MLEKHTCVEMIKKIYANIIHFHTLGNERSLRANTSFFTTCNGGEKDSCYTRVSLCYKGIDFAIFLCT